MATKYAETISSKVILVTGASPDGLGEEFCLTVAKHQPKLLILAGRSVDKLRATETKLANMYPDVSTRVLELDLESISKAAKAAAEVNAWEDVPVIDLVVNNSAIMAVEFALTGDGFEKQLAVNYLAPWVFTNSITPKILASGQPRIVFVSSSGHRWGPVRWHDYNFQVRVQVDTN
jgi:NAD(P)-dependent dehydrogenase (short-subunit alcohol dehydrogenase family)